MVRIGYTMMTGQTGPGELVEDLVARARAQFRRRVGGWRADSGLPGAAGSDRTAEPRPEALASAIACEQHVDEYADAVRAHGEAETAGIARGQVGAEHQWPFLSGAEKTLLPAPRRL